MSRSNIASSSRCFPALVGNTDCEAEPVHQPNVSVLPMAGGNSPTGLSPSQVTSAYGVSQITFNGGVIGNGSGQTIAIVDAYDDPNISSDLGKI